MDLLTRMKGISFSQAWRSRLIKRIEEVRIPVLSLQDLITTKKATARWIDLEDVKILKRIQAQRSRQRR